MTSFQPSWKKETEKKHVNKINRREYENQIIIDQFLMVDEHENSVKPIAAHYLSLYCFPVAIIMGVYSIYSIEANSNNNIRLASVIGQLN